MSVKFPFPLFTLTMLSVLFNVPSAHAQMDGSPISGSLGQTVSQNELLSAKSSNQDALDAADATKPKKYDFYIQGRPADTYELAYTTGDAACGKLLASLNQQRTPIYQRATMVEAFETRDLLLGNAFSVNWSVLNGEPRPIWYTEVADVDNDGTRDALILLVDRLYGWTASSAFILDQPLVLGADPDEVKSKLRMPETTIGRELSITSASISTDDPAPIASNADLGGFFDVVVIDERAYALIGGRLGGKRPLEHVVDLRLLQIDSPERQTEICRFHPKYYPAY